MAREPEVIAELRRALGERLATCRKAAALTQGQLAKAAYCDRTRIAHLERGSARADGQFWRAADHTCQAGGVLLAAFTELEAARQQLEQQHRSAELASYQAMVNGWKAAQITNGNEQPALFAPDKELVLAKARELRYADIAVSSLPSPEDAVAASQETWRQVRHCLIRYRTELAKQAVGLYDQSWRVPNAPALAPSSWLPPEPLPIEAVSLEWDAHPTRPLFTGEEAELRPVLPLRTPRHAFPRYTSAIRYLDPPTLFENRPSYRLLDVSWEASGQGKLRFGLATFFDKLDVSEALGHELALAAMDGVPAWSRLPFRALLSHPADLSSRTVGTSIATLTVRRSTSDGSATFFLLRRDPAKVAAGGGQYGVVPAGEFQPACIAPDSLRTDLDLWCNIVREYSEELLGQPEHDGSSGQSLDYDCWPFYRDMQRAREAGQVRAYVLGVVLHALGLNAAVCTAVVMDDVVFDRLFRDLVTANAEGSVVTSLGRGTATRGLPFTEETVLHLLGREPFGGTSAACLALAWRHRVELIGSPV